MDYSVSILAVAARQVPKKAIFRAKLDELFGDGIGQIYKIFKIERTCCMSEFASQPWLNEDGTEKSEKEIQRISKSWTPDTWEAYLQTIDVQQNEETEILGIEYERVSSDDYANLVLGFLDKQRFPRPNNLKRVILFTLKDTLSVREFQVIDLLYWKNLSTSDVAQKMKIGEQTVRNLHSRSLKKIRKNIFKREIRKNYGHLKELGAL